MEDLLCTEEMADSDTETNCLDGTEMLQLQLEVRRSQIVHSLGIQEMPWSSSPDSQRDTEKRSQLQSPCGEDLSPVQLEEYGAEVYIDAKGSPETGCDGLSTSVVITYSSDKVIDLTTSASSFGNGPPAASNTDTTQLTQQQSLNEHIIQVSLII